MVKIAELEKILGVSRQAIYDKLKQDKYRDYVKKEKGIKVVSPEGVTALKLEYGICKEFKEELCATLNINCKENQDFKVGVTDDFQEIKAENHLFKELIKEFKDRIKYLEDENKSLIDLLNQQNSIMKQQNNLVQNEQQITLNHTELLLLEKREVLRLRQEQHEKKIKKGIGSWFFRK